MQMIAASKMNRAQNMVKAGRPYADRIRDVLGDLAALAAKDDDAPTDHLQGSTGEEDSSSSCYS